jgi:hypothetical protein
VKSNGRSSTAAILRPGSEITPAPDEARITRAVLRRTAGGAARLPHRGDRARRPGRVLGRSARRRPREGPAGRLRAPPPGPLPTRGGLRRQLLRRRRRPGAGLVHPPARPRPAPLPRHLHRLRRRPRPCRGAHALRRRRLRRARRRLARAGRKLAGGRHGRPRRGVGPRSGGAGRDDARDPRPQRVLLPPSLRRRRARRRDRCSPRPGRSRPHRGGRLQPGRRALTGDVRARARPRPPVPGAHAVPVRHPPRDRNPPSRPTPSSSSSWPSTRSTSRASSTPSATSTTPCWPRGSGPPRP